MRQYNNVLLVCENLTIWEYSFRTNSDVYQCSMSERSPKRVKMDNERNEERPQTYAPSFAEFLLHPETYLPQPGFIENFYIEVLIYPICLFGNEIGNEIGRMTLL